MNPYTLTLDVWEGNLDIDEALLLDGGVSGLTIRMNGIDGDLHLDENFLAQWEQADRFSRAVYAVFTPWRTGKDNFEFVADHMPKSAPRRMFWDMEVKRPDYSPKAYGAEARACYDLTRKFWEPTTYTGAWCLTFLDQWPEAENWWARYPYFLYPKESVNLSWAEMRAKLDILRWVPDCKLLGECKKWQCSGDRYKLPGTNKRCVDINVSPMTPPEYREWLGVRPIVHSSWAWDVTLALRELGKNVRDPE